MIKSIVLILVAALSLCACKTSTTSTPVISNVNGVLTTNLVTTTNTTLVGITITPTSVYNTLRGGSAVGSRVAIKADTNAVAYLNAVRQVLGDAISSTNYNSAALTAAIKALPLNSIHSPAAIEAINGGFEAFQLLEPQLQTQLNAQSRFIIPALQGIYDGIGDALGIAAPLIPTFGRYQFTIPSDLWMKVTNTTCQLESMREFKGADYLR